MPRRKAMKPAVLLSLFVSACALTATSSGFAAPPVGAAKPHATAEPQQREITYADLETQVGKRIIVHTTLGTVRSGVLIKYTKTEFEIRLDEGMELTIPAGTIRSLSIPVQQPDPALPTTGDSSAKKN